MTQALHRLASNPDWQQEIRAEAERIVQALGMTTASIGEMRKLDSFLREQQRYDGLGIRMYISMRLHNAMSF